VSTPGASAGAGPRGETGQGHGERASGDTGDEGGHAKEGHRHGGGEPGGDGSHDQREGGHVEEGHRHGGDKPGGDGSGHGGHDHDEGGHAEEGLRHGGGEPGARSSGHGGHHDHERAHGQEQHTHAHEAAGGHGHEGLRARLGHLLAPHSHDAADSVDDALTASGEGINAVKISLLGLGVTAVLQLVVAMASGSVAVLADTIHNFADASTAIPLWLAFWIGRRPANARYTYGYGRAEDLAGVFVLLMIVISAAVAFWESLLKLLNPTPIDHLGWVAAAGLAGFIGNEWVAQYRIRAGERIGSAALVADGYHARTDGLTSLAVLFGAAGVWLGFPIADPLVGLLITVAILIVLKGAAVQMWRRLMDAVDPHLIEQATAAAGEASGVLSVTAMRARWIGHEIHAEALIVADADLSLDQAHEVAERARHKMLHAVPKLSTVTVHVDPSTHDGHDHHAELAHHDSVRVR
jgi:cation diffusion facilitator family transporter